MTSTTRTGKPAHIIDPMDEAHCMCGAVIKDRDCSMGMPILLSTTTARIRQLAAEGTTFKAIAAATGTSTRTVALLVHAR